MAERCLQLSDAERDQVLAILDAFSASIQQAWVFGSRAASRPVKPHADLDILVDAPEWTLADAAEVAEAFSESDLPFRVDLLRLQDTDPSFIARLMAGDPILIFERRATHV
jgi:uncharacterized protein